MLVIFDCSSFFFPLLLSPSFLRYLFIKIKSMSVYIRKKKKSKKYLIYYTSYYYYTPRRRGRSLYYPFIIIIIKCAPECEIILLLYVQPAVVSVSIQNFKRIKFANRPFFFFLFFSPEWKNFVLYFSDSSQTRVARRKNIGAYSRFGYPTQYPQPSFLINRNQSEAVVFFFSSGFIP